jgi:hypothetical protein
LARPRRRLRSYTQSKYSITEINTERSKCPVFESADAVLEWLVAVGLLEGAPLLEELDGAGVLEVLEDVWLTLPVLLQESSVPFVRHLGPRYHTSPTSRYRRNPTQYQN